jgi:hypothetical protein
MSRRWGAVVNVQDVDPEYELLDDAANVGGANVGGSSR